MLWVRIPLRQGVLDTTLCDKVCQWLAAGLCFSLVSSINKTDRHYITEILLKVALNTTNQPTNQNKNSKKILQNPFPVICHVLNLTSIKELTKHLIRDIISGSCFLWSSTIFFAMNFWILTFKFLLDYAEYNLLKLQPVS